MMIPHTVIKKALNMCANRVGNWPSDEWFTLDANWDMNLYVSEGFAKADICPVEKGITKSELAVSLLHYKLYAP